METVSPHVKLLLVLFVAAQSYVPAPALKLTMLGADAPKCLDGSGSGYYISRSQNPKSNEWVVFMEGGSMCFNATDCSARKQTHLGSSKYWSSSLSGEKAGGIDLLSDNATLNPDFHGFNHLYIPYCSGDVFVGKQDQAINPFGNSSNETFYFQGFNLVTNVTAKLLMNATKVLLTGCSAGSIGDFFLADYFSETLPKAIVKAAPSAGWFGFGPFDRWEFFSKGETDPDPYHVHGQGTHGWLANVNTYAPPAIIACYSDPKQNYHLCRFSPFIYAYIKTPFFIAENLADSFQLTHGAGMPHYWPQSKLEEDYIVHFASQLRRSLIALVLQGPKNNTDGLFAPACYAHFLNSSITVLGTTWFQSLGNWFFDRPGQTQTLDTDLSLGHMLACASAPPMASANVLVV